jgi:spore germination protein YaaH
VVGGDSLTSIAKRFGTTPQSIAYWNRDNHHSLDPDSPAYRPNVLKIGWTLRIIPNSAVDPEDLPTLPPGG